MIEPCEIPPRALLLKYRTDGAFADCYATHVAGGVTLARYVEAFYTTWLFKLERGVLALAGRPSSDEHARQLAQGARDGFAAWTVESRDADQLLLCDILGRTRSWLMVAPEVERAATTRLYFGSAVVPKPDRHGRPVLGAGFHALLGFHRLYSRALLSTARRRLQRSTSA
jgi:hypothetical protein